MRAKALRQAASGLRNRDRSSWLGRGEPAGSAGARGSVLQAQTWSFITRVIGRRWRKRCQEVSDVTETLQSLPGCSVADGEPDTSREAVAVIGRLGKR